MTIETKFNDVDKIFFIHNAKVLDSVVRGFKIERTDGKNTITYLCNKDNEDKMLRLKVEEENGFPTKEALLQSL